MILEAHHLGYCQGDLLGSIGLAWPCTFDGRIDCCSIALSRSRNMNKIDLCMAGIANITFLAALYALREEFHLNSNSIEQSSLPPIHRPLLGTHRKQLARPSTKVLCFCLSK